MKGEPSAAQQKQLRSELNAELGYYPALLDTEDIEQRRRGNAVVDRAPDIESVHRKWAWHRELRRRAAAEAEHRAQLSDLYDDHGGLLFGGGKSALGASGQ